MSPRWAHQAGLPLDSILRSIRPSPTTMCPPSGVREKVLHQRFTSLPQETFVASLDKTERATKNPSRGRFIKLGLRLFVCMRFQDLFHSPPGVLFAFPSRYWFTIGRLRVFSLGGWSPHIQTGFLVSRPTCRILSSTHRISCKGLSPSTASVSKLFHYASC